MNANEFIVALETVTAAWKFDSMLLEVLGLMLDAPVCEGDERAINGKPEKEILSSPILVLEDPDA